ncbi:hypothetical protein PMAYCL1PPCAC_20886, partial [Pristionchus mayeri]
MVAELKKQLAKIGRMPEDEMPLDSDRPCGVGSSSRNVADSKSRWVDAFRRVFSSCCRHINAVDTEQMADKGVINDSQ